MKKGTHDEKQTHAELSMKKDRNLLTYSQNIQRSAFIWNALSSMLLAAQPVIVMMMLTRTLGVADAGVFSFAHANANLLFFIGEFGLRKYQASDVKEQYKAGEYYAFRSLSCLAMVCALIFFCIYAYHHNQYTFGKVLVVFFVGMCLTVQAVSEGHESNMQQKGRLDIAAKTAFLRTLSLITAYVIGIFLTRSLLISSILAFVLALTVFLTVTFRISGDFNSRRPLYHKDALKGILTAAFPIFLTLFLNNYIANAPKYAIDRTLGDELQAVYGFLFMPTYAIGILCNFIFNPLIVKYAQLWTDGKIHTFTKLILRQILIILGMTCLAVAAARLVGIPVLSLIYNTDLGNYRGSFCILILGGGMWAFCTFFTTIITIMRRQNLLFFGYAAAAAAAFLLSERIIVKYGIPGAAWLYTGIMTGLTLILLLILYLGLMQARKKSSETDSGSEDL